MSSVSPKIASPRFGPVTVGYFGDLAATAGLRLTNSQFVQRYLPGCVLIGIPSGAGSCGTADKYIPGCVLIGIPSGAGSCGTAADAYTPTRPNIRMAIL